MVEHFDAVIVGSGFGGSVMAHRLAEAGMRVCVLERGKPYPPGSFPRSPTAMRDNFWDPSEGRFGLFDFWQFSGLDAVVSSGLGGGSLIYANVLIRKDEKWFVQEDLARGGYEYWPVTPRELEPHYERVERMLGAQQYPYQHEPFSDTPKLVALRLAAERLGQQWIAPNLAVAFRRGDTPGVGLPLADGTADNMFGAPRFTCRMCGECNNGCNFGSKSSLDLTYLSRAAALGAELRTGAEVRRISPHGHGYLTQYVARTLGDGDGPRSTPPVRTLVSDYLILAAGTLGSTFLLLQHAREGGPFRTLSPRLGTRFSGNGDLLTFVLQAKDGARPRQLDPTIGPVITSAIRIPDALDGGAATGRGFYVQDAGYPNFVAWLAELGGPRATPLGRALRFVGAYVRRLLRLSSDTTLGAELAEALGEAVLTGASMPLLNMGRDTPDGMMSINRAGRLDVDWQPSASEDYLQGVRRQSERIANELGGEYRENPLSTLRRLITVHPLGGCPMGRHPEEGVVDAYGEVFGFPGLFVADGSVMPGPVGPNPALTIGALSDRFAERLAERWRAREHLRMRSVNTG